MQKKLTYKTMEDLMEAMVKFNQEELKQCKIKISLNNMTWIIPLDCTAFAIDIPEKEIRFYAEATL